MPPPFRARPPALLASSRAHARPARVPPPPGVLLRAVLGRTPPLHEMKTHARPARAACARRGGGPPRSPPRRSSELLPHTLLGRQPLVAPRKPERGLRTVVRTNARAGRGARAA